MSTIAILVLFWFCSCATFVSFSSGSRLGAACYDVTDIRPVTVAIKARGRQPPLAVYTALKEIRSSEDLCFHYTLYAVAIAQITSRRKDTMNSDDFISLDASVADQSDIVKLVGEALQAQSLFEKRTSPWERASWDDQDLENFKIQADMIQRLYYIDHYDDGISVREFELAVKTVHKGKVVYASMTAGCDCTGFYCQGDGEIYVTRDAQIFLKSILRTDIDLHNIWKSMVADGLNVEEPSSFDLLPMRQWNNVPMLKFLCHMKVYDERDKLRELASLVLPKILAQSVEEFLKTRETKDHHDEWR